MRPCLPSVTVLRHCSRWVLPRGTRWASSLSNSQEITPSSPGISQTSSPLDAHSARHDRLTFEDLGLHPPIIASLQAAFPHVRYPTDVQARFIPAILEGKDVLLKDVTGSGKSFGLTLALLNKPRLVSLNKREEKVRHITSLVLVPHRELGLQLMHWIERMVNAGDPAPPLASIAQLLIRDDKMHLTSGVHMLEEVAPHMLIGTPQAVMDVYERHPKLLQLDTLSTVVVDEVDYLVETPSRKDPGKSFKKAAEKAKRKLLAHPGPTRHLLNTIYSRRIEVNQRRNDEAGWEIEKRRSGLPSDTMMPPSPQLVVSSATLRTHLRDYLYNESGWLDRDRVVKISGSGNRPAEMVRRGDGAKEVDNASIMHSVLLVSENRVRNIPGAVTTDSRPASSIEEVPANDSTDEVEYEIDPAQVQKYSTTKSPFNPYMMEAIAVAFAVDVPSIALLVLPSSSSVMRAVWELRELGVNAVGLDLQYAAKGRSHLASGGEAKSANPTLLVSTLATTRGIDLPSLSHVFLYGLPEGPRVNAKSVDAYLHISGRVGRFGRGGRVVTFVEDDGLVSEEFDADEDEGNEDAGRAGDAWRMNRILKTVKVQPTQFPVFD